MRLPRQIIPYGNSAILLEWEQKIDPDINIGVHTYANLMWNHPAVKESIPAYCSLLVRFDSSKISAYKLKEWVYKLSPTSTSLSEQTIIHQLPVVYGGDFGPDIEEVAKQTGLSVDKIIKLHQKPTYTVYQLGYKPGFAFLGETVPELAVDRRDSPRAQVPAGSVGLAGRQTAVYPHNYPGGWQLIGRCPASLWDVSLEHPTRLKAGDQVKFYAIDQSEWEKTAKKTAKWER